jgi:hypothetical protein
MKISEIPIEMLYSKVSNKTGKFTIDEEHKKAVKFIKDNKYHAFLPHVLAYLAEIPVVSNKPTECLQAIKKLDHVNVFGEKYSATKLICLIKYITEVSRTNFILARGGMTNKTIARYGSLTPLVMLALKEKHKIPYTYWDKEDKNYKYFINSPELLRAITEPFPEFTMEEKINLRNWYIERKPATSNICPGFVTEAGINGKSPIASHITFQTWLACEDVRDTEAMILDINDIGNIPEPLVSSSVKCAKHAQVFNTELDLDF